jgi:hypothetical protein
MPGSSVFNNGENGFSVLDRFPVELLNGEKGIHRLMHVYARTCNYVHANPIVVKGFHKPQPFCTEQSQTPRADDLIQR